MPKAAKPDMKIDWWPPDRLIPYARNPKQPHTEEQIDKMAAGLREFGWRAPILALSDGTIVDGHLRLKAARKLGMGAVPVVLADDMTPAQVKAFRLYVKNSAQWAEWDYDLAALEIEELKLDGFDLDLTGFEPGELNLFVAGEPGEGNGGDNSGGAGGDPKTLTERFGVPPFSVLDARQGYWQQRKRAWLALGIQSELGRGGQVNTSARAKPGEKPTYREIAGGA